MIIWRSAAADEDVRLMADDTKKLELERAAALVDPEGIEMFASYAVEEMLKPTNWLAARDAIAQFERALTQLRIIAQQRKVMVAVAVGRLRPEDLVGVWADAQRFPPGTAMTLLINEVLTRRRDFFMRRRQAEPSLWPASLGRRKLGYAKAVRHTSETEEDGVCAVIDIVVEYSFGRPSYIGEFDPEIGTVTTVLRRIRADIANGLVTIEKARAAAEAEGRVAMSTYVATWALHAAKDGLNTAPALERDRNEEILRVVTALEDVKPPIGRALIADWVTEIGLARHSEQSLNVLINRLRRGKKARIPLRKKHTTSE